jgi:hypothetical protein
VSARLVALLAVVPLAGAFATPASAAGDSTPGVTVTARNPAGSKVGGPTLSLTAHTEASTVTDPSCRPEDLTLACSGSLVLRLPEYGDLAVGNFEVHRVAVGDISCGDEGGDDGCGDHGMELAPVPAGPVQAQVNGVGYVKWQGNTGLPVGTKVQLKITLTDNGTAAYGDQVVIQVNRFVEGPDKPLLYQSGVEPIQQIQVHLDAGAD